MRSSGVSADQPVTFKTKIKSSGYSTAPATAAYTSLFARRCVRICTFVLVSK
jgi:hypothetical protein